MRSKRTFLLLLALVLAAGVFAYAHPDQPNMQKALANLQGAKAELRSAEHNKGGHRAKALEYVNAAISEVNAGIDFDRRHNHVQLKQAFLAEPVLADQPHMRAALSNLESAKKNLEQADPDKGGHRVKAIDLVNKAIDEVNQGIAAGA